MRSEKDVIFTPFSKYHFNNNFTDLQTVFEFFGGQLYSHNKVQGEPYLFLKVSDKRFAYLKIFGEKVYFLFDIINRIIN
jgi:hypothetical protein